MAETLVAESWLYSVLTGDAGLNTVVGGRVYSYVAPQGAAMPFVIYQQQGAHDVAGVGPVRIMASMLYTVKVVGEGASFAAIEAAANRIDAVLQAASGSNVRGVVVSCVRESPFSLVESTPQGQFRHLGGIYRVYAQ